MPTSLPPSAPTHRTRSRDRAERYRTPTAPSTTLATAIAHELNNSLLAAAMLVESGPSADVCDSRLAPLIRQSQSLSALFLDLSSSGAAPTSKLVDLSSWLDGRVRNLAPTLPTGIEIRFKLPRASMFAYADCTALDQVFSTLVSNAVEAMKDRGTLTVDIHIPSGSRRTVEVRVADSGPGIPASIRGSVFKRGFSTRVGRTSRGLGLSLARDLLGQFQGRLTCKPNDPHGSVFIISLLRKRATP